MKLFYIAALLATGCANFSSHVTETLPDGSKKETVVSVNTLMDAKSELTKLAASQTDKTQRIAVGSLGVASSGSNVVVIVDKLGGVFVPGGIPGTIVPIAPQ